MSPRGHVRLFFVATAAWAAFWVAGLPSYYRQYSAAAMAWFDALVLLPLGAAFFAVLRRARPRRRLGLSLWMAFYFTVPPALYDWLYCGVLLGHGAAFLLDYWYLSVYYIVPWIVLPALAALLDRPAQPAGRGG